MRAIGLYQSPGSWKLDEQGVFQSSRGSASQPPHNPAIILQPILCCARFTQLLPGDCVPLYRWSWNVSSTWVQMSSVQSFQWFLEDSFTLLVSLCLSVCGTSVNWTPFILLLFDVVDLLAMLHASSFSRHVCYMCAYMCIFIFMNMSSLWDLA